MSRGTIFLEQASVIQRTTYPENQHVARLRAPECARHARAGMFVHIGCDIDIPMRRPISIMRCNPDEGWIEILYKVMGSGLRAFSRCQPGDSFSILGPIGQGFRPIPSRNIALLIGGGVGIPPLIFLAETLVAMNNNDNRCCYEPTAFFGSEIPFPFELTKGQGPMAGIPDQANARLKLTEDIAVPSHLASKAGISGCFDGYVTELAAEWLKTLDQATLNRVMVFACGPNLMLQAVHDLAQRFELPDQLCVEEYMACGVGGCAGCGMLVHTDKGPAMRRVCVDGPVFDGDSLDFLRSQEK